MPTASTFSFSLPPLGNASAPSGSQAQQSAAPLTVVSRGDRRRRVTAWVNAVGTSTTSNLPGQAALSIRSNAISGLRQSGGLVIGDGDFVVVSEQGLPTPPFVLQPFEQLFGIGTVPGVRLNLVVEELADEAHPDPVTPGGVAPAVPEYAPPSEEYAVNPDCFAFGDGGEEF